ncbi:hypothetical protein GALL_455230 [mine drainage metagenome]|uniref:Uncharacterized protein n=1 Tax=mine drainage metagenome TaxID=410659 RepID=A0A1J5PPW4_9ZZZZ
MKPLHQRTTLVTGYATRKQHMAPVALRQSAPDQFMRAQPLAKHHRFGRRVFKQFIEQRHQLIHLVAMVGFMVKQVSAVASHAHVLQGAVQATLVGIRQKTGLAPARHDAHHGIPVFVMVQTLLGCQGNKDAVIHALWQLRQHLGLAPAQHHRLQRFANVVKTAIPRHPARLVAQLVFAQDAPGRPEPVLIDKLHDRNQFFQPVFQRGAGQHHGIGAGNAFEGTRGDRVPVFDALRLIGNHQVRGPGRDQVGITRQCFVMGDLAESVVSVLLLALGAQPVDHLCIAFGKAGKLILPLVLE